MSKNKINTFKYKKVTTIICAFASAALLTLSGCSSGANVGQGDYRVYFTNNAGTRLTYNVVHSDHTDKKELLGILLNAMEEQHKSDELIVLKPSNVQIKNFDIQENKAIISYSPDYLEIDNITEVFYRTGVIKTVTQISGIDNVDFLVGDVPAVISSGEILSDMKESDFYDDTANVPSSTEWKNVTLYFTNEAGDKLIRAGTNVAYNQDISLENIIVAKLIAGPNEAGLYPSIPSNVNLLGVSVSNGVCYVNFDESFLNNLVNASGELPIYSIVNSLCSLDTVRAVRIMINGSSDTPYRDTISLDREFTADESYVDETITY